MKIVALAGGVGAAKLIWGLARKLAPEDLCVVVNTGDDFHWMSLYVCPDLDTITYTLAGLSNPETGWGVKGETFHSLGRLREIGCESWFRIGDRDLATHIFRTDQLHRGHSLAEVTCEICRRNGIPTRILPMTNSPVQTLVHTDEADLDFQDYFVRLKCTPRVRGFTYRGIEASNPSPGVMESLMGSDAVIVCPSNPFISIHPILSVPGIRRVLGESAATVLAVSPIIGNRAIKGPCASMMAQLGMPVTAASIAALYRDFLDIFVLDSSDEALKETIRSPGMAVRTAPILMDTAESKEALAATLLEMLA